LKTPQPPCNTVPQLDNRYPRSPIAFVRPVSVAHKIMRNDEHLITARSDYVSKCNARLPDTSKEEEEERLRQEAILAEKRRQEEEEMALKLQKEQEREAALKANERKLHRLISETVAPHLEEFRILVHPFFLRDKIEFDAIVRKLASELLPLSESESALSKIEASALLFRNLGPEKEQDCREEILKHVDRFLDSEIARVEADED
jgi:hypothetical protein